MKEWKQGRVTISENKLFEKIKGKTIGVMMNTSAIDSSGKLLIDTIAARTDTHISFFLGMEHGVRGNLYAGDGNIGTIDEKTGIPIVNLYTYPGLKPPAKIIETVDAVVFCAQDVGVRHWTYTPWMMTLIEAAAKANREVIVLDRPNPIRGDIVEGEMAKKYIGQGLVSGFSYPLRHGMTIGELALMYNDSQNIGANLTVIPMEGWRRDMWYDETGLIWLPPSPNMPTTDTPLYFSATGLLQSSNFSLGIGTTTPFQYVGSPHFSGDALADELNSRNLEGIFFVPKYYKSRVTEHVGADFHQELILCDGVMMVISDRNVWRPVSTQLHIMDALLKLYPEFTDLEPRHKTGDNYARVRMCSDDICECALRKASILPLVDTWKRSSELFMKKREPYLLY